jgi:hypothetical protein
MATTKIKLWQLQSAPDGGRLLITDLEGKLTYLLPDLDKSNPVLSIGDNGIPQWSENIALSKALEAINSIEGALTTANGYTDQKIAALVDGAPVALDTLKELADKLGEDGEALAALIVQLDGKANKNEVYKKADVNLLVADRYQAATAYTDSLKNVLAATIKVPKTATLVLSESPIDGAQFLLSDLMVVDGDQLPADKNLTVAQVFINGQLGMKQTDYGIAHQGSTLDQVKIVFPAENRPDQMAALVVTVHWEEPIQINFGTNPGGNA